MKHFLIKYRFKHGSRAEPSGTKTATTTTTSHRPKGERAVKTLGERDFFSSYTKNTEAVAGGDVEVLPLEVIAETKGAQRKH